MAENAVAALYSVIEGDEDPVAASAELSFAKDLPQDELNQVAAQMLDVALHNTSAAPVLAVLTNEADRSEGTALVAATLNACKLTFVGLLKDRARRRDELHAVVLVIAHFLSKARAGLDTVPRIIGTLKEDKEDLAILLRFLSVARPTLTATDKGKQQMDEQLEGIRTAHGGPSNWPEAAQSALTKLERALGKATTLPDTPAAPPAALQETPSSAPLSPVAEMKFNVDAPEFVPSFLTSASASAAAEPHKDTYGGTADEFDDFIIPGEEDEFDLQMEAHFQNMENEMDRLLLDGDMDQSAYNAYSGGGPW